MKGEGCVAVGEGGGGKKGFGLCFIGCLDEDMLVFRGGTKGSALGDVCESAFNFECRLLGHIEAGISVLANNVGAEVVECDGLCGGECVHVGSVIKWKEYFYVFILFVFLFL